MTTQTYRLKISRVNSLKLKVLSKFPAAINTGNFLTLTTENGVYTFDIDYSVLTPGPISDPATAFVAIEDKTAGIYREVSLASLLTSGVDTDLQAIAALTGAGILVRTADNTWSLRTVTGTANEITVTNGDGVLGNPTLSLPSALTFTGKTVTGGSFTGATITNSTYNGNTWTAGTGVLTLGAGKTATISNTLTFTGTDGSSVAFGAGGTVVYTSNNLSVFSATTSAQLSGIISDETGSGSLVFATSPTLVTPVLGTPSSVTLTNGTGLPIATGVSGLGTGVATFLATPSSANLRAALTDEVGTGAAYFVGGALGTPASGVATNLTGTASGLTAGNVTTNANLTGDVTSVGNAATIPANKVTNAKLATASDGTIKSNISGSTATPSDNTITAVLDKLFGTTQGSVIYRGASTWGSLTPGTSGNFLKTQGAAANPVWSAVPGGGDMLSTNNLSDVANVATARANIGALGTRGDQTFTSSGTFTTPANSTTTTVYHYRIIGGGGGGGGSNASGAAAGGGGSGAYAEGTFTGIAASTGITITVGANGGGGASGATGTAGGNSSIGSPVSITAGGGNPGVGTSSSVSLGGTGGTVTGTPNIVSLVGEGGYSGIVGSSAATLIGGGDGGKTPLGYGGKGGRNNVASTGSSSVGYGSGGGGAFSVTSTGGNGSQGIVIIDWVL